MPPRKSRHLSWASDTTITAWLFVAVLVATVLTDWLNGPNVSAPPYLTGLLGASGAILFGAAGSDKSKRDKEVSDTAARAEAKADDALGRSTAVTHMSEGVLAVQERELIANKAALQSMQEAVDVKESSGIPVMPETYAAMAQLKRQVKLLESEIDERRKHAKPQTDSDVKLGGGDS